MVSKDMAGEIHSVSFADYKHSSQLDVTTYSAPLSVCLVEMAHTRMFPLPPAEVT